MGLLFPLDRAGEVDNGEETLSLLNTPCSLF